MRRFRLACELVRNGRLGKIQTVETRIGDNPQRRAVPDRRRSRTGSTGTSGWARRPRSITSSRRCHYEFRWWYEYSGGKVTDWGAHHNDIAQWGLGMDETGPVGGRSPSTTSPRTTSRTATTVHPHFKITYTYAEEPPSTATGPRSICTNDGENGIKFIGENGDWIFVDPRPDRGQRQEAPGRAPARRRRPAVQVGRPHAELPGGRVHSREKPIADVAIGHRSASVCHIGNISLRMGGRTLRWMPEKEKFFGDALADEMLSSADASRLGRSKSEEETASIRSRVTGVWPFCDRPRSCHSGSVSCKFSLIGAKSNNCRTLPPPDDPRSPA